MLGWIQIESCHKTVKLVRVGHIEIASYAERLYKCNFLAFMFICRSVRYIPGRYVSSHNHTTMDNQRMSWNVLSWVWGKAQRQSDPFVIGVRGAVSFHVCMLMCVCVYLGSLSCPCLAPWPRPSSYIREAWKQVWGHLERPISNQRVCCGGGSGGERWLRNSVGDSWWGVDRWDKVCAGEREELGSFLCLTVQSKGHKAAFIISLAAKCSKIFSYWC